MRLGHSVKIKANSSISRSACGGTQITASTITETYTEFKNIDATTLVSQLSQYRCNRWSKKTQHVSKTCNNRSCYWFLWERCSGGDYDCSYDIIVDDFNSCSDTYDNSTYNTVTLHKIFPNSTIYSNSDNCLKYGTKQFFFYDTTYDCISYKPNGTGDHNGGVCASNAYITHPYTGIVPDTNSCLSRPTPIGIDVISNYKYLEPDANFIDPLTTNYYRYYVLIKAYDENNTLLTSKTIEPTQIVANGNFCGSLTSRNWQNFNIELTIPAGKKASYLIYEDGAFVKDGTGDNLTANQGLIIKDSQVKYEIQPKNITFTENITNTNGSTYSSSFNVKGESAFIGDVFLGHVDYTNTQATGWATLSPPRLPDPKYYYYYNSNCDVIYVSLPVIGGITNPNIINNVNVVSSNNIGEINKTFNETFAPITNLNQVNDINVFDYHGTILKQTSNNKILTPSCFKSNPELPIGEIPPSKIKLNINGVDGTTSIIEGENAFLKYFNTFYKNKNINGSANKSQTILAQALQSEEKNASFNLLGIGGRWPTNYIYYYRGLNLTDGKWEIIQKAVQEYKNISEVTLLEFKNISSACAISLSFLYPKLNFTGISGESSISLSGIGYRPASLYTPIVGSILSGPLDNILLIGDLGESNSYLTVMHEIGHALGLIHEQQRTDKNRYLNVNQDNVDGDIIKKGVNNFFNFDVADSGIIGAYLNKILPNYLEEKNGYSFGYDSMMIYAPCYYSKDNDKCINERDNMLEYKTYDVNFTSNWDSSSKYLVMSPTNRNKTDLLSMNKGNIPNSNDKDFLRKIYKQNEQKKHCKVNQIEIKIELRDICEKVYDYYDKFDKVVAEGLKHLASQTGFLGCTAKSILCNAVGEVKVEVKLECDNQWIQPKAGYWRTITKRVCFIKCVNVNTQQWVGGTIGGYKINCSMKNKSYISPPGQGCASSTQCSASSAKDAEQLSGNTFLGNLLSWTCKHALPNTYLCIDPVKCPF